MIGVILVGEGTLAAGVAIQRFLDRQLAKQHREVKENFGNYFDTDVFSSEHSIATFIESNYPAFPMSGKKLLWALSDDGYPCAVAYDAADMLVCRAELSEGEIHRRCDYAETIEFTADCVRTIWLLRNKEESPVYEVDILYNKNGVTRELKIIRFIVNVDGGMNIHNFRNFVGTLRSTSIENNIYIRDFIKPG